MIVSKKLLVTIIYGINSNKLKLGSLVVLQHFVVVDQVQFYHTIFLWLVCSFLCVQRMLFLVTTILLWSYYVWVDAYRSCVDVIGMWVDAWLYE